AGRPLRAREILAAAEKIAGTRFPGTPSRTTCTRPPADSTARSNGSAAAVTGIAERRRHAIVLRESLSAATSGKAGGRARLHFRLTRGPVEDDDLPPAHRMMPVWPSE